MQFEAVTTSRKSSLLSGALALCSVIGVMFTASPAGAMLWSPGNSPLAAALGSVTEACQAPVAFAPGYEGDHPLQRLNRAIVASVAGAESKIQSIDFSAAANPPQKAQCMVIYYAQEGQYLPEP